MSERDINPAGGVTSPDRAAVALCTGEDHNSQNTLDRSTRLFMDVGVWGGGLQAGSVDDAIHTKTTYGAACGNIVALCSWLPVAGARLQPPADWPEPLVPLTSGQDESGRRSSRSGRGFVLRYARLREELTPLAHPILFIPDLHITLFRELVTDNFVWGNGSERHSLESGLDRLLTRGESNGFEAVQVGDCFEMWEVLAHLIEDHAEAAGWLSGSRPPQFPAWKIERRDAFRDTVEVPEQFQGRIRPFLDAMIRQRKAIPRSYSRSFRDAVVRHPGEFRVELVSEKGVLITQQDAIRLAIMERYPNIFRSAGPNRFHYEPGFRFHWIQGNHDNMLANRLYGTHYPIGAAERLTPRSEWRSTNRSILVEHGHELDEYNNNDVFDDPAKGYAATREYTLNIGLRSGGGLFGETAWREGAVARYFGDVLYHMRPPQLRRAQDLFKKYHPFVKLIVMGHTHAPLLVSLSEVERCLIHHDEEDRAEMERWELRWHAYAATEQ